MDTEASTQVNSKGKNLAKRSLSRKNSHSILMPWEKRHQRTMTHFLKRNHSPKNSVWSDSNLTDTRSKNKSSSRSANEDTCSRTVSERNFNDRHSNLGKYEPAGVRNCGSEVAGKAGSVVCSDEYEPKAKRHCLAVIGEATLGKSNQPDEISRGSTATQQFCHSSSQQDDAAFRETLKCAAMYNLNEIFMYSDLRVEKIPQQRMEGTCAITSFGKISGVLDKAAKGLGKYNLDGLFERDNCKDKNQLWKMLDISGN